MDYRRLTLITLFAGLIGWLALYIIAHYVFISVYIAPLFIVAPYASLLFAIIMFFMTRKWLSVERLLALLLLLPILLTTVIPRVNHQFNLYKTPTDALIRSYFESVYFSQLSVMDLSAPLVDFNDQNKTMELNVKMIPELLFQQFESWKSIKNQTQADLSLASYIMKDLEVRLIRSPKKLNEHTLKPDYMIVRAYWGNEWLMEVHYQKVNKEYEMIPPYPKLSLIEEDGYGYFLIQSNDTFKKIKAYDSQEAGSYIKIDLKVT